MASLWGFIVPIKSRVTHRPVPSNTRSVDVAHRSLASVADIQRMKAHNAFLVDPHEAVLYHRLTAGIQCSCANRDQSLRQRLDPNGNATPGYLNELLSGGLEFGHVDYRRSPADSPDHEPFNKAPSSTLFSIDQAAYVATRDPSRLPARYDNDSIGLRAQPKADRHIGDADDLFGDDPDSGASTLVTSGKGQNGVAHDEDWMDIIPDQDIDPYSMGHNDNSCPFCFGTGFVSGFSPFRGFRAVLNHQSPGLVLPADAEILFDENPVSIKTSTVSFDVLLPFGAKAVDAFRLWNGLKTVQPQSVAIDGVPITAEHAIAPFCDGRSHTIVVDFSSTVIFTHLEIQVSQTPSRAFLSFPKISRNSQQTVLENMDDVQIILSPVVPMVSPGDYIAESVYGKVFQVKTASALNTSSTRDLFGWEIDARPLQPKELATLLPKAGRVFPSLRTVPLPGIGDKWRT